MKKICYRIEAVFLAVSIFFGSILYKPVNVYAVIGVDDLILMFAAAALGHYLFEPAMDWVDKKLGWKPADLQVDENGNVILSEAQMQELKKVLDEYTQDENGNDKYGMYLYESTNTIGCDDFLGVNAYYDSYYWQDRGNLDLVLGLTDVWFIHSNQGSYTNAPPAGSIWVCPDPAGTAVQFYHSGTLLSSPSQYYRLRWTGNNWEWYEWAQESGSAGTSSTYFGKPQTCFLSLEGARRWKNDGSPYTLVAPTYTGGNLVISPDQLRPDPDDPDDPDNPGDPDDEPTTETGWLKKIYDRLGDILKQLKQIKWLTVVDTIIDAVDAFGDDVVSAVAAAADAVTGVLQEVFPLCIFWDIILVVHMFEAEPLDPVWEISIDFSAVGIREPFVITIDLTPYEPIWTMIRVFEILFFVAGLWKVTLDWVGKGDDV